MRLRRALTILALGSMGVPGAAVAAPTWIAPTTVSAAGRDGQAPAVALNARGDAVAVWQRSDGANTIVQARYRPAGGSWSAVVDLSVAGADAEAARVALADDGTAIAVWQRRDAGVWLVQAAVRPATTGLWAGPSTLSSPAGENATRPRIAAAGNGDATVVWQQATAPTPRIMAVRYAAGTGTWGAPDTLDQTAGVANPEVGVGAGGDAVAAWEAVVGANTVICFAVRVSGSATWAGPGLLSPFGIDASAPRVVVDRDGNAAAVWVLAGTDDLVQARYRPAAGSWGAIADLSAAGADARHPDVGFAGDGTAVAIWEHGPAGAAVVQARVKPPTGGWQSTESVSPAGENGARPELAVDLLGNAVAVYTTTSVTPTAVTTVGVRRAVDTGTWSPPAELSGLDGQPAAAADVAVDGEGNALATWEKTDGTNLRAHVRALDAAGPSLDGAVIPASFPALVPQSLSVAPVDVWSAPAGSANWVFGDGSPAGDGLGIAHAWPAAGLYFVTLTAADTVGNTRILQQLVTVGPPPPAPAPAGSPPPPVVVDPPPLVSDIALRRDGQRWRLSFTLTRAARLDCWLDRMSFVVRRTKVVTAYVPMRRLCPGAAMPGTHTVLVAPRRRGLYHVRVLVTAADGAQVLVRRGLRVR